VAAAGLYAGGFRVGEMTLPGGGTMELGLLDAPLTVLWLVFMTNAMNLIDGQDGVAAGIAALVGGTMAYIAYDLDHELIALLFATLAGASFGFVQLNLPPARRLLGDSGAYFLGFALAGLSVAGFVDTTGRVPLYIPVVALGLPVLDTSVSFLRRVLDGRNPMSADADHFHHRMQYLLHLRPLQIAFATYALTALFCVAALLLHNWYKTVGSAVVGAVVLAFALTLVVLLGYVRTMWGSVRGGPTQLAAPESAGGGTPGVAAPSNGRVAPALPPIGPIVERDTRE
jgi:UDP-GlcNAc:undecaprenyl-phosphate GlcNAc-1-phosphate transferase